MPHGGKPEIARLSLKVAVLTRRLLHSKEGEICKEVIETLCWRIVSR